VNLLLACINKLRAFDENLAGRFQLARSETATSGHGGNGGVSRAISLRPPSVRRG